MLKLVVDATETYNEETNEFSTVGGFELELEHSLLSVSKWESEHQKAFLSGGAKTSEEIFSYLKAMVVAGDPELVYKCSQEALDQIQSYIDSSQTATTFAEMRTQRRGPSEVITSELIYYWMVSFNIPFECEKWHLNRLFALIKVCNIKNSKPKKMSRTEIAQRNREINAQRRAQLGTSG